MGIATGTAAHKPIMRMTLGGYIRQRRKDLELTQDDLAAKAGISQGYVSGLERGINTDPDEQVIVRLANALVVGVVELMKIAYPDRPVEEMGKGPLMQTTPAGRALYIMDDVPRGLLPETLEALDKLVDMDRRLQDAIGINKTEGK